jgi:XTP/dITP diphosphohydrolase
VFAGAEVAGLDDIVANWERIKKAEKARSSALDGIALAQPALSLGGEGAGHGWPGRGGAPPLPTATSLGAELPAPGRRRTRRGEDPGGRAARNGAWPYMEAARAAEA